MWSLVRWSPRTRISRAVVRSRASGEPRRAIGPAYGAIKVGLTIIGDAVPDTIAHEVAHAFAWSLDPATVVKLAQETSLCPVASDKSCNNAEMAAWALEEKIDKELGINLMLISLTLRCTRTLTQRMRRYKQ